MNREKRISSFIELGKLLNTGQYDNIIEKVYLSNHWFTPPNVANSIKAVAANYLDEYQLRTWYQHDSTSCKKVGVVMAGNIPAVGFHDALCVLISGNVLMAKLSSDDRVLMTFLFEKLIEIDAEWSNYIQIVERLNDADAYIATGSDNTARYFEYYFSKKPHIIRKNRTSVGIINGQESTEELMKLGNDVLQYFGLGCRNVSKIYVPEGYVFVPFFEAIEPLLDTYRNHHKYFNNYEYNKSVYLINREPHFDNGYLMLRQSETLVSPISVLFYETYENEEGLKQKLEGKKDKIQCIVSQEWRFDSSVAFGQAQSPSLLDYADGIDTMAFLNNL